MPKKIDYNCSISNLRRSRRQRKPVYDTLNQSFLFNQFPDYLFPHREMTGNRRILETSTTSVDSKARSEKNVPMDVDRHHPPDSDEEEILDIYSHVKRRKRRISSMPNEESVVFMSGSPPVEDSNSNQSTIPDRQADAAPKKEGGQELSSDEDSGEEQLQRRYFLRQQKAAPQRFKFDFAEPAQNRKQRVEMVVKPEKVDFEQRAFQSPAHKRTKREIKRRRRHRRKLENASSSSSDSDSSSDEQDFERRKSKNMDRSRSRFMPVNMSPRPTDFTGRSRDRNTNTKIIADLDPMSMDTSITFQSIGGLTHHIQALKEMILFPLIYPEIFEKFKITPPRGVIFYGAPGTGKTLVARALANECSKADRKVAFFMRKGADCLSKWVGESERQLRLLFDQAYSMRPAIIFFDEIDGLAPVRSSRQDQIHSSIVSTLLALMDGLDQRGEVIVIGATNRLDAIDPALRRPGRFDRELLFTLPDVQARSQILKIHTSDWTPPLSNDVIEKLAEKLVGYCGADIKGLCTESALIALRKRYPQIYCSDRKLLLDARSITVTPSDFEIAMQLVIPSSRRMIGNQSKPIPSYLTPLFSNTLQSIMNRVFDEFKSKSSQSTFKNNNSLTNNSANSSQYDQVLNIFNRKKFTYGQKLLFCGDGAEHGQTNHLAPALFHALDHLPIFSLSLPHIFSSTYRSPEEAVSEILSTAVKFCPCVLYIPTIDVLMRIIPHSAWYTLTSVLQSWSNTVAMLLLSTSNETYRDLDDEIKTLFDEETVVFVSSPYADMRRRFFDTFLRDEALKESDIRQETNYEQLELAPPPRPKKLTENELKKFRKTERQMMRQLRIFLREILSRLIRDRRFVIFSKPVDPEQAPDYAQIVAEPIDLSTMMCKIDQHKYQSIEQFLADIDLITQNALEYNPNRDQTDKLIRHRACALRDVAYALIEEDLDSDFEVQFKEIKELREKRGVEECPELPPAYVYVAPLNLKSLNCVSSSSSSSTNLAAEGNDGNLPSTSEECPGGAKKNENGLNSADPKASKKKNGGGNGAVKKSAPISRKQIKACRQLRLDSEDEQDEESRDFDPIDDSLPSCSSSQQPDNNPTVVRFDESMLSKLLDMAVARTDGWSITRLEKLYFALMRAVEKSAHLWNRNDLLNELENLIRTFN